MFEEPLETLDDRTLDFLRNNDAKLDYQLKALRTEIDNINSKLLRIEDLRLDLPESFQDENKIQQVFMEFDTGKATFQKKRRGHIVMPCFFNEPAYNYLYNNYLYHQSLFFAFPRWSFVQRGKKTGPRE